MTLADFIASVCKEVLVEENILGCSNNDKTTKHTKISNPEKKVFITESKLREMIKDNRVSELTEESMFTPLARDTFREYKNNHR